MVCFFFVSLFLVICFFDVYEGIDVWCNFKEGEYEIVVNILVFIINCWLLKFLEIKYWLDYVKRING